MSIHKPPLVKHPVKVQRGNSNQIVYRTIRDVQYIKNSQPVGRARVNGQSRMVRKERTYWVVV